MDVVPSEHGLDSAMTTCFYEEVVHSDVMAGVSLKPEAAQKTSLEQCMNRMAFWAMSLQEIHEEQKTEGPQTAARCLCAKAHTVHQSIDQLQEMFAKASEVINVEDIERAQTKVQNLLR